MKLDWELFNDLLKRVENLPPGDSLQLDDPAEVGHALLLQDGGMVELIDAPHHDGHTVFIKRLTLQGHNYLDHIRNETVHRRLRQFIAQHGGKVAVDVLVELAKRYAFELLA
ncbi:DUF2513 domain-containing protein [Oceanithermus sp.]